MTGLNAADIKDFLLEHLSGAIAARGLDPGDIADDLDLFDAGIVDSLGVIEMAAAVEQHFRIVVDLEPMDPTQLWLLGPFSRFIAANAIRAS